MLRVTAARAAMFTLMTSVGLVAGNPAHAYTFITIDNPGDPNFNQLLGINNKSVIAGYFGDGSDVPNNGYTVAPPYTSFSAENFPGAAQTQVVGINNTGTTVGFWVDGNGNNFGFYYQGTTFISVVNPLGPSFNQLLGVNDSNVAAGFYNDSGGASHGYITTLGSGAFTAIAPPSSFDAASVTASDINNAGIVSGFFTDAAGNVHGFLDNGGTFTQLDDPNGNGTNTSAFGLNNVGDVVGSFVELVGRDAGFCVRLADECLDDRLRSFRLGEPGFRSRRHDDQRRQRFGSVGGLLFGWDQRQWLPGDAGPRALDLGHDGARLRRPRLCGISQGSAKRACARLKLKAHPPERERPPHGRPFLCLAMRQSVAQASAIGPLDKAMAGR